MTPPPVTDLPPSRALAPVVPAVAARAPTSVPGRVPASGAKAWTRHRRRPAPPSTDAAAPPPVRLYAATVPSPFAPGREVVLARVGGALLASLGVRHGDHVAMERTDRAEHGDLAAVVDASGRAALWRVYPEGDALRLSSGDPAHSRRTGPNPRVQGVVVGVLRKFST